MRPLGNLLTAMVTPFDDDLNVDYEQAQVLAKHLVDNGSDGLVVVGTTGEAPTLYFDEKVKLFQVVKEAVGDSGTVVAGTGSYSTKYSIELTQAAEKAGVDAAMLVVPYYNKPPQAGLYQHYKKAAEATGLPIIIYNIPGRTGCNIEVDTVASLAEIPNIVGIKEASKNMDQVGEIIRKTPDDFLVYSGDDSATLPILSLGGSGVVSVASHIAGGEIKEMIEAYFKDKPQKAARINQRLLPLFKILFITTNPIPVKAALNLMGIKVGGLRLPLIKANEVQKEAIRRVLSDLGYI